MDLELAGRVALVTGAGRGIGATIATSLAGEGCSVALVDLAGHDQAQSLAARLRSEGRRALAIQADVTSLDQAEAAVTRTVEELGGLDILVCNAGITRDGVVWKLTEAAWDQVLAVNLKGCFTFCRAVAPRFRAQQRGRIVTVASINGIRGKAGQANYAASKAGVIALTKTVARELGPAGITVNCVAPGFVATGMTDDLPATVRERALAESALGRAGAPEDVAAVVTFLCSGPARHLTGTVIRVDGGQYM
jgi:3-oxoacyl-[acyl-carrier protein] reductase